MTGLIDLMSIYTEKKQITMNKVFLDASYAIALSSPNDRHHNQAKFIADKLESEKTGIIATRAVILEIGNALAKRCYRQAAIKLIDSIENDENIEIVSISEQLYSRAFQLYKERPDKEWGLTDCISLCSDGRIWFIRCTYN